MNENVLHFLISLAWTAAFSYAAGVWHGSRLQK